jgi:hypothetical protein
MQRSGVQGVALDSIQATFHSPQLVVDEGESCLDNARHTSPNIT